MIRKNPFLIFSVIIMVLVAGALWFIQSPLFTSVVRRMAARQVPRDLGIEADFSGLSIKIFPPGISLRNPRVIVRERNALNLPGGSSVRAERIDLTFQPFQMLSGNIRIHDVAIVNGDAHLIRMISANQGKARSLVSSSSGRLVSFHWDELFHVHAESISMVNTRVRLDQIEGDRIDDAELRLNSFQLRQWQGRDGLGYALQFDLQGLSGSLLPTWAADSKADRVKAEAHVNASGVRLDSLAIQGRDHQVTIDGKVRGNVLDPRAPLLLDCGIQAKGDLDWVARLAGHWPAHRGTQSPSGTDAANAGVGGQASFSGHVKTNLKAALQALDVAGTLGLRDFRYGFFRADQASIRGHWRSMPQGGELSVDQAELSTRDSPRALHELARGGRVQVLPFKLMLGSGQAVPLRVRLERARLQWLAALGIRRLKQIYAIDFAASGPVDAMLTLPWRQGGVVHPLQLEVAPKLTVEDLQLDNQRPDERRPLHRIFAVPKLQVEGPIVIGPNGLRTDGLLVAIAQTRLKLAGKISNKAEYDLHAAGSVRLAELDKVADNAIRGDGTAEVGIHGPAKNLMIDIDLDVKDAYYLHLNLGNVIGRLTWDDDPDHLLFQKVRVTQGATLVALDGLLDLGKVDRADLKAGIVQGDIHDFAQIFSELTRNLSWFPTTLTGPFTGDLAISGGLSLDELTVAARFNGSSWEYLGERFDRVALQGGYDRGRFHLSDFRINKHGGLLLGHVSYGRDKAWDWDFHVKGLGLGDFDHVSRLDVPIRGKFLVDSTGHGKEEAIRASTSIRVTDVTVRGVSMPDSSLTISSSNGIHRVHGSALGSEGTLDMDYDFNPTRASHLRVELQHLDFSPVLLLLNPRSIPDSSLEGYVSGNLDFSFRSGQFERASGAVSILDYAIARSDVRFRLERPVTLRVTDGSFDLPDLSLLGFSGNNRSRATLALASKKGRLKGKVSGDVDLSMLQLLSSAVSRATGPAQLDFALGGDLKAPTVEGRMQMSGATLWVRGLDSPFQNIGGEIEMNQGTIDVNSIEADLAGGRFTATGNILLFPDNYPKIALRGNFYGNRIKVFPFQYVKIRGPITVHGDQVPYEVEGNLVVDSAVSHEKVFQQKQTASLKTAQYMPLDSQQEGGGLPLFNLHVNVLADSGIRVQNDLFDAELKGHVTVINSVESPRILGSIDLVQGKMIFNGRAFQLQQASAAFDNPAVINPRINLNGSTELDGVKVRLYVAGTMDNPKIDLSSTPVMSETDILNLLALGMTSRDTQRLSPTDRAMLEQGEAASLLLNSLDFNREVESKTGLQFHLDETMNNLVGASVFRPQSASETEAAPRIVIRKQITNNVNVTYGSTVGVGSSSDQEATAEVRMTPGVSVIGVWDNYEALDTQDRVTSYGLDLKFQKRFK